MNVWANVKRLEQPLATTPDDTPSSVWAIPEDPLEQSDTRSQNLVNHFGDGPGKPITPEIQAHLADPTPAQQQIAHDQAKLEKVRWNQEHPWGSAENHPGHLGKLAHVFSTIGNIAGNIVAPNVMARIPGTQLGMQEQAGELENQIDTEQQHEAENELRGAQTQEAEARAEELKHPQNKYTPLSTDQGEMRFDPKTGEVAPLSFGGQPLRAPDKQAPPVLHETDQGLMLVDPMTKQVTPLTLNGQPLMPSQKTSTNPKAALQQQLIDAQNRGDAPAVKKLTQQLKDIDPMGEQRVAISLGNQAMSERHFNENLNRKDIANHDKAYVQPAETNEKSWQMANQAYQEYLAAKKAGHDLPTGAQSMLMLSQHLQTTFGTVKGARVTKDMIHEHLGARSIGDAAEVAINRLVNGDALSPDQWQAFHQLIHQSRNESWKIATKEAARKHIPIDFLPPDLQTINKNGVQYTMGEDGQYHKAGE